jgi:hypothetical protein
VNLRRPGLTSNLSNRGAASSPKYVCRILARECGRQSKAWCGARERATPGVFCNQSHQARECGRQFFVVRAFIIIEASIAVARSVVLLINRPSYLGLRAVALHPKLYSVARSAC